MAKRKKSGGGGGAHTAKYLLKLAAVVVGGAVVGDILTPISGPVSGPALGVAALGAVVYGPRGMRSYATHALLPALGFQAVKSASSLGPMKVAKGALAGATTALKIGAGNATSESALAAASIRR